MLLVAVRPQIALQEVLIVLHENPKQGRQAVGNEGEDVLQPVNGPVKGVGTEPDQRRDLEVLVVTMDVGVGVVNEIVLM